MRKLTPKVSDVLSAYLTQCNEPPWTSYFIRYKDVTNDQWGESHFNWTLKSGTNYHILRTGCFPYMKYHCTKRPYQNLSLDNNFFKFIKVINLGLYTAYTIQFSVEEKGYQRDYCVSFVTILFILHKITIYCIILSCLLLYIVLSHYCLPCKSEDKLSTHQIKSKTTKLKKDIKRMKCFGFGDTGKIGNNEAEYAILPNSAFGYTFNYINIGQRNMKISVSILGLTLLMVMLAYFVFGDNNDQEGLATLRFIGIIFRHGDRAPTELYPTDPHINHMWPGGLGSLSEKGSLQMFNLGKNLRSRYYKLLPSNGLYTKENMFVLSSAAERCLMSAQSFLAGFMPPLINRNPLPISWQPIPINSLPRDRDYLLAQKKACPKFEESLKRVYMNPPRDIKIINEKNRDLYDFLTKCSGKNISNILDVEYLYNTLQIEHNSGLILPDWTEEVFPERMLPLAIRSLTLYTETPYMKRIKGGPLLTDILNNIEQKKNGISDKAILIYSAHDITLVNLFHSLNIVDQLTGKPDFASAFVLEIHYSSTFVDDFEVKMVYYFNSDDKFPKEIDIPNCKSPCSLSDFINSVAKIIVKDYDDSCQLNFS